VCRLVDGVMCVCGIVCVVKTKVLNDCGKNRRREIGKFMQGNVGLTKAVGYIDVRVFAHATENLQKVQTAAINLFPVELAQTVSFQATKCLGHYGNPITMFSARLEDRAKLVGVLENFGRNLSALDKEELCREINLHVERSNLYLRFDKQAAFLGTFRFSQVDPVHVKIHFRNKKPQEIIEISRQVGLLP
jgi:RNA binding exosome subunit